MPEAVQTRITKKAALEYLRLAEKQLYSTAVEAEVGKLDFQKKLDFFSARLSFTALIGKLNASLMQEIRDDLQAQANSIKTGIEGLKESLTRLEDAVQWAKAVNGITSSIARVVSLF